MEDKFITLASLPYSQAGILRSLLESENIDCFIEKIDFLQDAMDTGVRVRILEKDMGVAFTILEKMLGKVTVDKKKRENYVLVPIDFSDCSLKAALIGFGIAEKLNSKMVIYHSGIRPEFLAIPYSDVIVYDSSLQMNYEMVEQITAKKFEQFLVKLNSSIDPVRWENATPEYIVKFGEPDDDILSYIQLHPPRVVVMGIRGEDAKLDDLIGTTTASVVFNTKVPVLAIPEQAPDNWAANFKTVIYATNFEAFDYIAIDRLVKLVKPFDCKITCLHVYQSDNNLLGEAMLNGMREALSEKYPETYFDCQLVNSTNLPEAVDEFITNNNIDLLALTTRRRNLISRLFNPSVARKLLLHVNTPILVFHA